MKSIPGKTEPRVSRKEGEKWRGKQRVMVALSSALDNYAQLTPTALRWSWHKRGRKQISVWKHKSRILISRIFFLKCSVGLGQKEKKNTVAFEEAWKIHCNYWVGEKAVRLKDEGPALSLQRDPRLPWADFQPCCREKANSQSLPRLHISSWITIPFSMLCWFKVYSSALQLSQYQVVYFFLDYVTVKAWLIHQRLLFQHLIFSMHFSE